MSEVSTGPEDDFEKELGTPCTDFDWVTGALCYAIVEDLTLEDLEFVIQEAKTGEEFDSGVVGTIWLKDLVREHYESI